MAIDGRINVDVLFHDTDGTTSLKEVSLEDSTAYTSGKVAVVTGTVGTTAIFVQVGQVYKNAAGELVDFNTVERFAFKASRETRVSNSTGSLVFGSSEDNQVSVFNTPGSAKGLTQVSLISLQTVSTASYTLVIYGT